MITLRTLTDKDFPQFYQATLDAFSDYVVPYQPTPDSVRRMLVINGVSFDYSVGAFDGEKMVGFAINALGEWSDKRTVYNSGTGVAPDYRRQGISRKIFDFILPVLRGNKIEQYLLEVIAENEPALRLYQNLGFETSRRLLVFKRKESVFAPENPNGKIQIKEIETPDWNLFESFWTYRPSWQNSTDAIKRILPDKTMNKTILGLYSGENLAGYAVVFHNSGNVPQIVVAEEYRQKGFGRVLLNGLQERTETPLFVSNVDAKAENVATFLDSNGFSLLTMQYEMLLKL